MSNAVSYLYEFGPFRLDPVERLLLRDGHAVALTPKAFDVLLFLLQRSGHLVEKRELIEAVWPGLFVEEGNVCVMIHALRKAFGSDHKDYKYIETVSKRGYRFAAEVRLVESEPAAAPYLVPDRTAPDLSVLPVPVREFRLSPREPMGGLLAEPFPPKAPEPFSRQGWRFSSYARWAGFSLIPVALAGAVYLARMVPARESSVASAKTAVVRSLAVLPFTTMGEKGDDAYLGLGMSDAVTTKLGNTGKIVIRPTSALERYVGSASNPLTAGREQQVDAVLDGRIQRAGDRLRLTVQLIRVADGAQIWGDTFDEKYTNIFAVEDTVSEQVAQSIRLELTGDEQKRLAQRPTENGEAYQAYIKGRYFWNKRTTVGLQRGLSYFQEAVALDPTYTQAYVGVADSYALLGLFNAMPPNVAFPKARAAASKALEMNPEQADAHATLGFVKFYYDWDGLAAEDEFRHALRNSPNYAMAHTWYAEDLAAMGRFAEAGAEARLAQESDPVSLTVGTASGMVMSLAGQNDEAIAAFKKAVEIDPNYPRLHFRLGNAYRQKGMYQLALAEFLKAVQLAGGGDRYGDQYYEAAVGSAYANLGNTVEARKVLENLVRRSRTRYVPAYGIATIYAALGEKEHVFQWLEKGYEDRSTSMAYLKVDPVLKDYRSEPRFAALEQRVRF
jgi:DNA-binding winged helix-turn-helix (wHTH) protein/TolB-like protein/Tfp pilus assembly protein PilF